MHTKQSPICIESHACQQVQEKSAIAMIGFHLFFVGNGTPIIQRCGTLRGFCGEFTSAKLQAIIQKPYASLKSKNNQIHYAQHQKWLSRNASPYKSTKEEHLIVISLGLPENAGFTILLGIQKLPLSCQHRFGVWDLSQFLGAKNFPNTLKIGLYWIYPPTQDASDK